MSHEQVVRMIMFFLFVSIYERSDGSVMKLLKVYDAKQNTVKYIMKLIDLLFIDKQEFQDIHVKEVDEDPRIKAIYNEKDFSGSFYSSHFSFFLVEMQLDINLVTHLMICQSFGHPFMIRF